MKKLFDVPDSYKEHITKFDSSDGFLALGIIVTYFVVMTISGIIVQYISQLQITIIGGGINVFFVVLVLLCLKMRHQGIETIGLKEGIYFVYFFTVGLVEEVLFRGYLQTRLHSLLKHILLDVLVTGVLFVLMHFPFRMVAYDMSFWEIISNVRYIADLFITHLILSYIRIKSDSLYGAILPHWFSDFAYRIVIHI